MPLLLLWFVHCYNLLLSLCHMLPFTAYDSVLSFSTASFLGLTSALLLPTAFLLSLHQHDRPPPSLMTLSIVLVSAALSLVHLLFLALHEGVPLSVLLRHNPWKAVVGAELVVGAVGMGVREWCRGPEDEAWEVVEDWQGGERVGVGYGGLGGGGGRVDGRDGKGKGIKRKMREKYEALLNGSELTVESDDEDHVGIF